MTLLSENQYFLIKLGSVSWTHYFMSIHNLRYSVQLIKIATRNTKIFEKIPRFWRFKQVCARHSYVSRHGLYVVYIVTQTPSFRRSRDLDKSNRFRQIQELTNDYYSEIKIHNIFHIAYKAIEFSTNKKEPTITFPIPILERQRGSPCHGGFVHDRIKQRTNNLLKFMFLLIDQLNLTLTICHVPAALICICSKKKIYKQF